jgi:hypothetical protein
VVIENDLLLLLIMVICFKTFIDNNNNHFSDVLPIVPEEAKKY